MKFDQSGEICVISSRIRQKLNADGGKHQINKDVDYLTQAFDVQGMDRSQGIISVDISQSKLFLIDQEKTYFEVNQAGETLVEFAPELSEENEEEEPELMNTGSQPMQT